MNLWITGRIIDQMQIEARERAQRDRTHRAAVIERRTTAAETGEDRRARVGLAVARLGLRIAGHRAEPAVLRRALASPKLEVTR